MRKRSEKENGKNEKIESSHELDCHLLVDTVGNALHFNSCFSTENKTQKNQHFAQLQESYYIMFNNGVINVAHKDHSHCLHSFREKRLAALTDSLYSAPITNASKQSMAR